MSKKIILLCAVFALTSATTRSQVKKEPFKAHTVFGLKAGVNFSSLKPDSRNIDKNGIQLGNSYGIMADYLFQPNYAFSTDFLISTINGSFKFKDSLNYVKDNINYPVLKAEYDYNLRFLQIPISFKFRTKEIGYIKYYAQFGVAPCFLISSKATINRNNANGMPWNEDDRKDIKTNSDSEEFYEPKEFDDDIRFFNLPIQIGGGIEYNISENTSIYSNLRYENGFSNILSNKKGNETILLSKNVSFSVGVFF